MWNATARTVCGYNKTTMSKEIWVEADLWNVRDEESVEAGEKAPVRLSFKVDTGTWQCVLPESVGKELQLPLRRQPIRVTYGDGRTAVRKVGLGLRIRMGGRDIVTYAVIEPDRTTALVGSIALEDLGFDVDLKNGCLEPAPGTESGQCTVIE